MLKKFRRRDYWELIGDADGFTNALNKLGIYYKELRSTNQGYAEPNSIWGQLAKATGIPDKDSYDTRKWLYTVWKDDRRKVRSKFKAQHDTDYSSQHTTEPFNDYLTKANVDCDEVILCGFEFNINME